MYFGLPDEAIELRDGLREVLASACTPATIRRAWDGDPCDDLWKTLAEYGVLGLLVPEERGGLGLDELSFVAAMEECGYAGVPGPLVETVASLPHLDLPLDGSAWVALGAGGTASTPTVDRSRWMGRDDALPRPVSEVHCQLGTAAFLLGLARRQVDMTVAYAKDRHQFGVPIGSFQGLKHPLAEAVVGTELAWPVVQYAAHALATGAADASLRVSHAKAAASDAAYRVSRVCLQAHGAIGYTVEYDLHLFMKRTWALAQDWGSASDHRTKIAEELL